MTRHDLLPLLAIAVALVLGAGVGPALAQDATDGDRTTTLLEGDGGDVPSGAHDIEMVTVWEDRNSTFLLFNVSLADVSGIESGWELSVFVDGVGEGARFAYIANGSAGAGSCGGDACWIDEDAGHAAVKVGFDDLGDPAAGDNVTGIWFATYQAFAVDRAPGPSFAESAAEGGETVSYVVLGPAGTDDADLNQTDEEDPLDPGSDGDDGSSDPAGSSDADGGSIPGPSPGATLAAALGAGLLVARRRTR